MNYSINITFPNSIHHLYVLLLQFDHFVTSFIIYQTSPHAALSKRRRITSSYLESSYQNVIPVRYSGILTQTSIPFAEHIFQEKSKNNHQQTWRKWNAELHFITKTCATFQLSSSNILQCHISYREHIEKSQQYHQISFLLGHRYRLQSGFIRVLLSN